ILNKGKVFFHFVFIFEFTKEREFGGVDHELIVARIQNISPKAYGAVVYVRVTQPNGD
ncbi:Hypothetical predicted protein, partial [Paramuricea clavata]